MTAPSIRLSPDPQLTDEVVFTGLRSFNETFLGPIGSEPLAVDVLDDSGNLIGGAVAAVHLTWLFIHMLWLPENLRGGGTGTQVLRTLEQEALARGAKRAILDTMSFQAEGFYARRGYTECGRVPNFASGYDRIYMIKDLISSHPAPSP